MIVQKLKEFQRHRGRQEHNDVQVGALDEDHDVLPGHLDSHDLAGVLKRGLAGLAVKFELHESWVKPKILSLEQQHHESGHDDAALGGSALDLSRQLAKLDFRVASHSRSLNMLSKQGNHGNKDNQVATLNAKWHSIEFCTPLE